MRTEKHRYIEIIYIHIIRVYIRTRSAAANDENLLYGHVARIYIITLDFLEISHIIIIFRERERERERERDTHTHTHRRCGTKNKRTDPNYKN